MTENAFCLLVSFFFQKMELTVKSLSNILVSKRNMQGSNYQSASQDSRISLSNFS